MKKKLFAGLAVVALVVALIVPYVTNPQPLIDPPTGMIMTIK